MLCWALEKMPLKYRFLFFSASKNLKMFVLDEADEMLSRGFKDQIYDIFQKLTSSIQVGAKSLMNQGISLMPSKFEQ